MDYGDQHDVNIERYIEKLYSIQGKTKPTTDTSNDENEED